jgi:hypothetical protein
MGRGYAGQVANWDQSLDTGFTPTFIHLDRLVSGRFYATGIQTNQTVAAARDNLWGTPFFVPVTTSFDRISCNVTTQGTAAALVRLGIYSVSDGLPKDLVLDAGAAAADTTGQKDITISVTLPRGWYALTLNKNEDAITLRRSIYNVNIGQTSLAVTQPQDVWSRGSTAYGALPSTWGSVSYQQGVSHSIGLRAA